MNLQSLVARYAAAGCTRLFAKILAGNDNSKNQVYFGPGFRAAQLFPNKGVEADGRPGNSTFKAKLAFEWLLADGRIVPVPGAQLILYPQYPEVRFSGFLRGAPGAPNDLMASRLPSRVLFLGIRPDGRVIGYVSPPDSPISRSLRERDQSELVGVFLPVPIPGAGDQATSKERLITELRRVHLMGWIDSKQLDAQGNIRPCAAPQCGGFTLEAELGIPKNSVAEPDFLGWEIKQHSVSSFDRPASGKPITLMTPEPTGGVYREKGPEDFVRQFGYADRRGRKDRLNFGGVHRVGTRTPITDLEMVVTGYDPAAEKITDARGEIALLDRSGTVAASWSLAGLLAHWSRKHSKAVYVPSRMRQSPGRQYSYGSMVRLGMGTDSLKLLRAFASGLVYYDPGIKVENASSDPEVKRRSQFRIASRSIAELYERMEIVSVTPND